LTNKQMAVIWTELHSSHLYKVFMSLQDIKNLINVVS